MQNNYICPIAKKPLKKDDFGNLYSLYKGKKIVYKNYDGSYDFAKPGEEKNWYEKVYSNTPKDYSIPINQAFKYHWMSTSQPENQLLIETLYPLENKKILLLGNGFSRKELYFLKLGVQKMYYSDLSMQAVLTIREWFKNSEMIQSYGDKISFNAIDALNLPFPDESIDIVYGYYFAHHMRDTRRFLEEVYRVLRKGGKCVFLDTAYCTAWQVVKKTILKPLMLYSHWKTGISPEDLRVTKKGGYKEEEIKKIMEFINFKEYFFIRVAFFLHLWKRGVNKIIGSRKVMNAGAPVFHAIDSFFAKHFRMFRENQIKVVWGFHK